VSYTVEFNTSVTLICNLETTHDYPIWRGPVAGSSLVLYNLETLSTFRHKQERLSWADNKRDLVLNSVTMEEKGSYYCAAGGVGIWFIDLFVRGKTTPYIICHRSI